MQLHLLGFEMFDLIIVDDLQMVRHSYEWQEGLFHLINRLREHQNRFYIWQMIQHESYKLDYWIYILGYR